MSELDISGLDIDVSRLPTYTFGVKSINWWGTMGLVVIEGFMLALCVSTYFYLRTTVPGWPPPPTRQPDTTMPTIVMGLLLLALPLAIYTDVAARADKKEKAKKGVWALAGMGVLIIIARAFEFDSLNTRWDSHAYGSIVWMLMGIHTFHVLSELGETIAMGLVLSRGHKEGKYMSNTSDSCIFWYFIILVWLPIYLIIYYAPRVL